MQKKRKLKVSKDSLIREAQKLGLTVSKKERYNDLVTIVNTALWMKSRKKDKIS